MRINEYNNLDEFISEYIGVWNPSDGHWFGLDFSYNGETYRLHTGSMYSEETNELPDGRETMFGLYFHKQKPAGNKYEYALLGKFADMNDLLDSNVYVGAGSKMLLWTIRLKYWAKTKVTTD